jgi:acyl CoA:acetate/3-ketoacid CoA transferase alpha subunit
MKPINKVMDIRKAISRIKDGDRIMVGGFGLRGAPNFLVDALVEHQAKDLAIISNDLGSPGIGLGKLLCNKKIKNLIGNYYNWNSEVAEAYNAGEINVTLVPQGTFASPYARRVSAFRPTARLLR